MKRRTAGTSNRKLALRRETMRALTELDGEQLAMVAGGFTYSITFACSTYSQTSKLCPGA